MPVVTGWWVLGWAVVAGAVIVILALAIGVGLAAIRGMWISATLAAIKGADSDADA